jgi:hypothetical protein
VVTITVDTAPQPFQRLERQIEETATTRRRHGDRAHGHFERVIATDFPSSCPAG